MDSLAHFARAAVKQAGEMQAAGKQHDDDLVFRLMRDADLEAVSRLVSEAGPYPWSRADILSSHVSDLDQCWLLCEGSRQQVIGYAVLHTVLDEGQLLNICTERARQGCGYGGRLLQLLLDHARVTGLRTVFLEVRDSNRSAIALYEKAGFRQISIRTRYYPAASGAREDARIYSLSLS